MKVTFVGSQPIAENIRSFNFKPSEPVKYIAGQFIELTVPHDNPDERGIKHWFTLSSSPTEDQLTITTKYATDRSSTFKQTLFKLPEGTELEMEPPDGDFTLPDDAKLELIFVAGGIGVTPYHSMIKFLTDKSEKRSIKLLYGLRSEGELAFRELFTDYGVDLQPIIGQPLTTELIMKAVGDPAGKLVYVSGPEPMVEALNDSLLAAGLPANQLKTDYFPNYKNDYSA